MTSGKPQASPHAIRSNSTHFAAGQEAKLPGVKSKLHANPLPPTAAPDFAATQIFSSADELPQASNTASDLSSEPPSDWQSLSDDSAPVPLDLLAPPYQAEPTIGHVGRYALKHGLGQGGLGRVYSAWDPILSRNLAIKTLQFGASGSNREALDALILAEARAVAGLSHPNIVTVFDAGLSDLGVYIAMEHLPGCDLRALLEEGWRPDPLRATKLVRRVAEALDYAHAKGVIHCDIKPANIFMVDKRTPKVLDFGIARVAHRSGQSALDGLITGSPHYVAPEQLRGETPDARTDVYALGVVLYELLTGRRPFAGRSIQEINESVLEGHVVPAHMLAPNVPSDLSAIAAVAMALHPWQRFASAREMSNVLRQWHARNLRSGRTAAVPTLTQASALGAGPSTGSAADGPSQASGGRAASASVAASHSPARHRREMVFVGALTFIAVLAWGLSRLA